MKQVQAKLAELKIDCIYLQYLSVTGRVMGKACPARHWEQLAKKGVQTFMAAALAGVLHRSMISPCQAARP